MKKRVLQVFASLDMGGAECRMMDVYRSIDRNQFDFDFVTLQQGKQFFENEIRDLGGKVYKLNSPRDIGIKQHIKELRACIRNGQYDAVHAHTSYHCGLVMYAAKKEGVPVRITHARTNDSIQNGIKTKAYIEFGRFLINRYSTNRLAISNESGNFVFGNSEFEVVPNSIDLRKYNNIDDKQIGSLKDQLGICADEFAIGHVGRFDRFKNQRFVIDVFFEFLKTHADSRLILTGDGELRNELELYAKKLGIEDRVRFTGIRDDIPELMKCFNVLLFPSIIEGLGGVVLEAQAAGIPAVISENVPISVDVGLDLVKQLSLNAPITDWVIATQNCKKIKRPDFNIIEMQFDQSGYSLEASIKKYVDIYKGSNY